MTRSWRRLRTPAAVGTVAGAVVGLCLVAPGAATAGTAHRQAARSAVVTVGDARFEVLSPTLVRTEYAWDGRFEDRPTFNAIGRDSFTPPHFSSSVRDGVLTLTTSALTLRYRIGSGPFDAGNLVL